MLPVLLPASVQPTSYLSPGVIPNSQNITHTNNTNYSNPIIAPVALSSMPKVSVTDSVQNVTFEAEIGIVK